MITRRTTAELTDLARGLITREYLLADLSRSEWQMSLMLILSGLSDVERAKIGLILVPMAPHHHTMWIGNTAPGCTFKCTPLHRNDLDRFIDIHDGMVKALFPEPVS